MSMTDPIADLLTRIRNAHLAKHDRLDVPASKLKLQVLQLLKDEGFIKNFRQIEAKPVNLIRVILRYNAQGTPAISHIAKVSKPGRRVYRRADEITPVRNGMGVGIVSTSSGILSDATARERRVGGELLCEIW